MQNMYSMRSPAVKRLMKEAQELSEPTEQYFAQPLEDNLFEWHFTIRGPADSDFNGGVYHGRIVLPPEYPMKPPSIILLTPNGRFETNKKICLSISGHHPESWQPSWSIRTALLAIIGFMPTHGAGAIGSLDYPPEERKKLAKKTQDWKCPTCGIINNILKPVTAESEETTREAKELASQINFQAEKKINDSTSKTEEQTEKSESQQQVPQSMPANSIPVNGAFPFPPPFMRMPGFPPFPTPGGSDTRGMVPRFPPPPPFIPGMFPPGFLQNPAQSAPFMQQWQMNPLMAGRFPFPQTAVPTMQGTNSPNLPTTVQQVTSTGTTSTCSSQTSATTEHKAETTTETSSKSTPSTLKPNITDTESASSDSLQNPKPDNTQRESEQSNLTNPSENIPQSEVTSQSSSTVTGQISSTVTGQSSSTITGQRPTEGLRQRLVEPNEPIIRPTPAGRVGQSAELRDHSHSASRFSVSTVLIFIIGFAIAMLLIRRFFLSRNWRFYYGV